jgi:glutamate racemase
MDDRPVGIFDSGVGGLSVYRAFRAIAPNEDIVYFADTAFFPYGPRTAAEVSERCFVITRRLLEPNVKLIVVACNTASAAAIAGLRKGFDVPFVGMVPGVKPATSQSRSGRVTILATPGTRRMLTRLWKSLAGPAGSWPSQAPVWRSWSNKVRLARLAASKQYAGCWSPKSMPGLTP